MNFNALREHVVPRSLSELFAEDPDRANRYVIQVGDLRIDYSKHPVDDSLIDALVACAVRARVMSRRDSMCAGAQINVTERRAVLHTALRAPRGAVVVVDGVNVVNDVHEMLGRMSKLADSVRADASITDIVNIGIGGSDLGPSMAATALSTFGHPRIRTHFVSNVDGADITSVLASVEAASTLFIVVSKSFNTIETLMNARTARAWLVAALGEAAVEDHFIGVSSNSESVADFGITAANTLGLWDWVGGRYSIGSAVGLSLMILIGPEQFGEFLEGFRIIDDHFRTAIAGHNAPVVLGMLGILHNNVLGRSTKAVLPYSHELRRFPAYLQQLDMESNGKRVMLDGSPVNSHTGPIIWGEPGTNGQHAFFQMLHQGTRVAPVDFIGFANPNHALRDHHDVLMANLFSQAEALAFGSPNSAEPHRSSPGNRPSTMILAERLTPSVLGQLIALYEHIVFVQGAVWGVNSFDQWGVELGKELSDHVASEVADASLARQHDSSTNAAIDWYRERRS